MVEQTTALVFEHTAFALWVRFWKVVVMRW